MSSINKPSGGVLDVKAKVFFNLVHIGGFYKIERKRGCKLLL